MKTFAQAFCEHVGCAPEDYLPIALKRCLYPQAHFFYCILPFFARAADIELLEDAGAATSPEQLQDLLRDYRHELRSRGGFLAKRLKLRVSSKRLHKLFVQVMSGQIRQSSPQ